MVLSLRDMPKDQTFLENVCGTTLYRRHYRVSGSIVNYRAHVRWTEVRLNADSFSRG